MNNNTTYNTPANAEQLKMYDDFMVFLGLTDMTSETEDFAELMGIGEDGKTAATVDDLVSDIKDRVEQLKDMKRDAGSDWTATDQKKLTAARKRMNATITAILNA